MPTLETPENLAQRYQELLQQIHKFSPDPANPAQLLAVSKGQSAARIRELAQLGQVRFGENYAQELWDKVPELADLSLQWVYIGHLQSNKIRRLVESTVEIQTLSQWSHAIQIARAASALGRAPFSVYLEIKVDDEPKKSGLSRDEILPLAARISKELPELRLRGLMAIPPSSYQDHLQAVVPELYLHLRRLADQIGDRQLSLGMSGDLRLALGAGSNVLRIGRALLGERAP